MKKATFLLLFILLVIETVQGQQNKFLIGIYDYDSPYNYSAPAGTIQSEGNDLPFLTLLANQNFNFVQMEWQLYHPLQLAVNSPSKQFLDNASAVNMKVILTCPEVSIADRANPPYKPYVSQTGLNYYGNHAAMMGFSIVDEPGELHYPYINSYANDIRNFDPSLLRMANLFPVIASDQQLSGEGFINPSAPITWDARKNPDIGYANYIQHYIDQTAPNMLSYDHYPLWTPDSLFFHSLDIWGRISTKNKIPYMYVLTPIKTDTPAYPCSGPTYGTTYSIPEYNYMIYGALAYGAKGLSYWHTGGGNCQRTWFEAIPTNTMTYLTNLHKKIIDNGTPLLDLSFRSAYHYSNTPTVSIGSYPRESIPARSQWSNLANDEYANRILNMSNPFTAAAGSSLQNLAVTFHTDDAGSVYFWVLNKNVTTAMDLNTNLKYSLALINVLNNTVAAVSTTQSIHLEPGEGKLYALACPTDYDKTESGIYSSDKIVQAQHDILSSVNISSPYTVLYRAGNSVKLTPGFHAKGLTMLGVKKTFNALIAGCYTPSVIPAQSSTNRFSDISSSTNDLRKANIYPNPSNGIVKVDFMNDAKDATIYVYNDQGIEVLSKYVNSESYVELNLSDQAPGIYLIKMNTETQTISEKIVIMK